MRKGRDSQLFVLMPWLCAITVICLLLISTPASAITESDKGTLVLLHEDAYRVPEAFLYEVKGNDNLHWLAAKFYGDARQWVRIYEANRETVENPNLLGIGQKLVIPPNL